MAISLQYNSSAYKLKHASKVKAWLLNVITSEKKQCGTIIFTFVSDEDLLKINKQFLKHNTYTDIITFDYTEEKKLNSEIFISLDRVEENAVKLKTEVQEELRRVMVHGVLHLCGYKDKRSKDQVLMRKKENQYLKKFA